MCQNNHLFEKHINQLESLKLREIYEYEIFFVL